jgi:hypothetical protein
MADNITVPAFVLTQEKDGSIWLINRSTNESMAVRVSDFERKLAAIWRNF